MRLEQSSQAIASEVKERSLVELPNSSETSTAHSGISSLSQTDFCGYLGEDSSNVAARARRRGFNTTEDYLRTIAQERKGEIWEREPGFKGKWVKCNE